MLRKIRDIFYELFLLLISVSLTSLCFPTVINLDGFGLLSFISLIPLFLLIIRTNYVRAPMHGFLFGFLLYIVYNYWLSTFHPLAIFIAPIIEGAKYMIAFPLLKLPFSLFKKI